VQPVCHDVECIRSLERESYHGGMCEPFYVGEIGTDVDYFRGRDRRKGKGRRTSPPGPVHCLDVAGLYPSVMRQRLYPFKLVGYRSAGLAQEKWGVDTLGSAIARVKLDTADVTYPVRVGQEVLYCTGRIRTVLAGPELVEAQLRGHLVEVEEIATYLMAELFTQYVDYWWAQRCQAEDRGDVVAASLAKLFLVSLYGKFGERSKPWEIDLDHKAPQDWGIYLRRSPETAQWQVCRAVAGVQQVRQPPGELATTFPAVSAFVTAYGRRLMRSYREASGPRQAYYQAMDALYVSEAGLSACRAAGLVATRTLGLLRLKGTADTMKIYGVHDYTFGDTIVRGGVSKTARIGPDGREVQDHFYGLRHTLAQDAPVGPIQETRAVSDREKYTRGKVARDGWVSPLVRRDF
jgi:DNA polymerase type B, organellar and viral